MPFGAINALNNMFDTIKKLELGQSQATSTKNICQRKQMLVFIRMIPESVTTDDLRHFINKGMGFVWNNIFRRQGTIASTSIFKTTNPKTDSVEYHGMVDIQPATSAQAAIRKLNRTHLKGRPVEIRKYFRRSPLRDRRTGQPYREHESFNDLREKDRRRCGVDSSELRRKHPLDHFGEATLKALTEIAITKEYKKNDELFSIGGRDNMVAFLIRGSVTLESVDGHALSIDHNHNMAQFGLANLRPRLYKAIASSDDTVLFWVNNEILDMAISGNRQSQGIVVTSNLSSHTVPS